MQPSYPYGSSYGSGGYDPAAAAGIYSHMAALQEQKRADQQAKELAAAADASKQVALKNQLLQQKMRMMMQQKKPTAAVSAGAPKPSVSAHAAAACA